MPDPLEHLVREAEAIETIKFAILDVNKSDKFVGLPFSELVREMGREAFKRLRALGYERGPIQSPAEGGPSKTQEPQP